MKNFPNKKKTTHHKVTDNAMQAQSGTLAGGVSKAAAISCITTAINTAVVTSECAGDRL